MFFFIFVAHRQKAIGELKKNSRQAIGICKSAIKSFALVVQKSHAVVSTKMILKQHATGFKTPCH